MSRVIKCPICSRTAEMTYRENRVYRSECFNINCKEVVTVTAPSRVAAEVPEFVGEFITKLKRANNNLTFAFCSKFNECPAKYWNEAIFWRLNHPEGFAQAWLNGYTVAKEKRFYLKHRSVIVYKGDRGEPDVDELYLMADGNFAIFKEDAHKFNQSEIDSMATDSYDQIEVEDNNEI